MNKRRRFKAKRRRALQASQEMAAQRVTVRMLNWFRSGYRRAEEVTP